MPDLIRKVCHLGDPAGVVGDRAISVGGERHPQRAQHAHGSDADAIKAQAEFGHPPEMMKLPRIAAPTKTTGAAVDAIPSDSPAIIVVAGPLSLAAANFLVGPYRSEVWYSADSPSKTPALNPSSTQPYRSRRSCPNSGSTTK